MRDLVALLHIAAVACAIDLHLAEVDRRLFTGDLSAKLRVVGRILNFMLDCQNQILRESLDLGRAHSYAG